MLGWIEHIGFKDQKLDSTYAEDHIDENDH